MTLNTARQYLKQKSSHLRFWWLFVYYPDVEHLRPRVLYANLMCAARHLLAIVGEDAGCAMLFAILDAHCALMGEDEDDAVPAAPDLIAWSLVPATAARM